MAETVINCCANELHISRQPHKNNWAIRAAPSFKVEASKAAHRHGLLGLIRPTFTSHSG